MSLPKSAVWSGIDQGTNSVGNVLVALIVAKNGTVQEFAQFSVVYLIALMCVGSFRALHVERMLTVSGNHSARASGVIKRAALWSGLSGVSLFVLGQLGDFSNSIVWPVCFGLFGLMSVEATRLVNYSQKAIRTNAYLSSGWLGLQVAVEGLNALWISTDERVLTSILAWLAFPVIVGVSNLVRLESRGSVYADWSFLGEYLLDRGTSYGILLLAGALLTQAQFAGLRATQQILFGILNPVLSAVPLLLIPKLRELFPRQRLQFAAISAMLIAATIAIVSALWLFLPEELGTALLGDTWTSVSVYVIPVGIWRSATALVAVCLCLLRVVRTGQSALGARLMQSILLVPCAGVLLGGLGPVVFIYCLALAGLLAALNWVRVAFRDTLGLGGIDR